MLFVRRSMLMILCLCLTAGIASAQSETRGVVQSFFSLLKAQKYAALYDYLPSDMQEKITREQLTNSLKRLSSFIAIERMEIGRVQQKGDFAVVDTTIYGKLARPMKGSDAKQAPQEGRVVVQQYLFKENGRWKVATADNATRSVFLKKHPEFKQGFQFTPPSFSIKQNGQWKALN